MENGKPTRDDLEHIRPSLSQARDLVDQAQRALRVYEEELWALERQELLDSIEAETQALLAAANEAPERRAEYLDRAARHAKAHAILSAPLGATA